MKIKHLFLILAICFAQCLFAQNEQLETIKNLYNNEKYDEVINYKPTNNEELTGKSLYYIAMAYYMKEQDENALKYFDKAITKGPVDYDMYYYKGMVFYYMKKYTDAISLFDKAISLLPDEPDFYGSKGDAYYGMENLDSALFYYQKATTYKTCKARYRIMVGEVLSHQNKNVQALAVYKNALPEISATDNPEQYSNCFYNIGLLQELTGDSGSAKATFEKFVAQYPSDYHAISKLIQAYYATGDYEKAKPLKKALYDAHAKDSLPEEMKKMFCFDQFQWNGKRIMVFENYDEPADAYSYVKHLFYVINENGDIAYKVQSESDAMLHKEHPDELYVLCLVKDNAYHTYWNFTFNDDVKYPDLKNAVLNILNDKVKPTAETYIGK